MGSLSQGAGPMARLHPLMESPQRPPIRCCHSGGIWGTQTFSLEQPGNYVFSLKSDCKAPRWSPGHPGDPSGAGVHWCRQPSGARVRGAGTARCQTLPDGLGQPRVRHSCVSSPDRLAGPSSGVPSAPRHRPPWAGGHPRQGRLPVTLLPGPRQCWIAKQLRRFNHTRPLEKRRLDQKFRR